MKKDETQRFLDVVDFLIKEGYANSEADIRRKAVFGNSTISEIRAGRSSATMPIIQKLVRSFNVNIEYILNGTGEIFKTNTNTTPNPPNKLVEGNTENKKQTTIMKDMLKASLEANTHYRKLLDDKAEETKELIEIIKNLSMGGGAGSRQSKAL